MVSMVMMTMMRLSWLCGHSGFSFLNIRLSIKFLSSNLGIDSLVFLRISSGMLLGSLSLGLFGGSMSSSFFLGGGNLLGSSSSELFFLSGLLSGGSFSSLGLGDSLLFLGLS